MDRPGRPRGGLEIEQLPAPGALFPALRRDSRRSGVASRRIAALPREPPAMEPILAANLLAPSLAQTLAAIAGVKNPLPTTFNVVVSMA